MKTAPISSGGVTAISTMGALPQEVRALGMVKLYYATDRSWTGRLTPPKWFNDAWNEQAEHLTYGTCLVTIPVAYHQPGKVEKPSSISFDPSEDPFKHVIVKEPDRIDHDDFFLQLDSEVRMRRQKEIVVFVHGFNNTFDDAASRLAVLAYDMDFNGVPVLYSWCSTGGGGWSGTKAYIHDSQIIPETIEPLTQFLAEVSLVGKKAGAKRISVVAHSMGNFAMVGAFKALADRYPDTIHFDEAVMAAPDVKEKGFASTAWPKMQKVAKRITLYASADDVALKASKNVSDFRRIGEGGDGRLVLPGLDTVDATGCDFSMLGLNHSYFGGPKVMRDLHLLTHKGKAPKDRDLISNKSGNLAYWVFP